MPITFPTSEGGKEKGSFQSCIDNNKDKDSPGGFCNHLENLQAKMGFLKLSNLKLADHLPFERKKKKKTDIHLLLNTPIEGMSAKLQKLGADFNESEHPRDNAGEFTDKGGEGSGAKKAEPKKSATNRREEVFKEALTKHAEAMKKFESEKAEFDKSSGAQKEIRSQMDNTDKKLMSVMTGFTSGNIRETMETMAKFKNTKLSFDETSKRLDKLSKLGLVERFTPSGFGSRTGDRSSHYTHTDKGKTISDKLTPPTKPTKPTKEKSVPGVKEYSKADTERIGKMFQQHPDDKMFNQARGHLLEKFNRPIIAGGSINKAYKAGDTEKGFSELQKLNSSRDLVKDGHFVHDEDGGHLSLEKPFSLKYPDASTNDGNSSEYRENDFKVGGKMVAIGDTVKFRDSDGSTNIVVTSLDYEGDEWEGPSATGYVTSGPSEHPKGQRKMHGDHRVSDIREIVRSGGVKMQVPGVQTAKMEPDITNLKIANLKLQTASMQTAFEESKHPRDKGGEFTTKGGEGAGGKKEEKKTSSKMSNLQDIADVYNWMERKVDPDQQGDDERARNFDDELISNAAEKFEITEEQAEEIWDSAGTTDIDISGGKKAAGAEALEIVKNMSKEERMRDQRILGLAQGAEDVSLFDDKKLRQFNDDIEKGFVTSGTRGSHATFRLTSKGRAEAKRKDKLYEAIPEGVKIPVPESSNTDTLESFKKLDQTKQNKILADAETDFPSGLHPSVPDSVKQYVSALKADVIPKGTTFDEYLKARGVSGGSTGLRELGTKKAEKRRESKLLSGSLYQDQTVNGDRYVSYFLLNASTNLKEWGVTPNSISKHIASFKGMPFVITNNTWFAKSAYGEVYDHPSTEHFGKLGIHRAGGSNEMMSQASFQEEFRVGNIEEIITARNGDMLAFIKILPQFATREMPPLVSPAIFQLNASEPADQITSWIGMHLAGLDEKPAYGNSAVFKGSCNGEKGACLTQLSAKLKTCPTTMSLATARLTLLKFAAQLSSDHEDVQAKPILCNKGGGLASCGQDEIKTGGGPGSGPQKGEGGTLKPFAHKQAPHGQQKEKPPKEFEFAKPFFNKKAPHGRFPIT